MVNSSMCFIVCISPSLACRRSTATFLASSHICIQAISCLLVLSYFSHALAIILCLVGLTLPLFSGTLFINREYPRRPDNRRMGAIPMLLYFPHQQGGHPYGTRNSSLRC